MIANRMPGESASRWAARPSPATAPGGTPLLLDEDNGVAPDLATGPDVEEPNREDLRVYHGEAVRGGDTGDAQDRAGIDHRAARPPADHRDVGVTQDQHVSIAGRQETLDRSRERAVRRDVLG